MKTLGLAVVATVLAGCVTGRGIPEADGAMAARSGMPITDLRRGHAVYLSQCGRCHEPVPPAQLEAADWKLVLPGMCWNAGLSKADEAAVTKYVKAAGNR